MKLRILYIMNVDWGWIKQRPHFLAIQLSKLNNVTVFYPFFWRRNLLVKNQLHGIKAYPFFFIPFGGKFKAIRVINSFAYKFTTYFFFKFFHFDILWVSSPELFDCLSKTFKSKLIYDCMDDVLSFPSNSNKSTKLSILEKNLIDKSTYVICSSFNILEKLTSRAQNKEKYKVIHNALDPESFVDSFQNSSSIVDSCFSKLGYFGTISSWLDFEALLAIVNNFPSIEIFLFGPMLNKEVTLPRHARIKYLGVKSHHDLLVLSKYLDALIMPFRLMPLIESVDPVKLYEYIYFDKPIISIRYPEVERFSDFVDFYENNDDLLSIVGKYLNTNFSKKYSDHARINFINANTWVNRVAEIERLFACF